MLEIHGVDQAVGVEQQGVAAFQFDEGLRVSLVATDAQNHVVAVELDDLAIAENQPGGMAGVAVGEAAVAGVEHAVEEGDKFADLAVAAEHEVDAADDFVEVVDVVDLGPQRGPDGGHGQAGGDAFAADVGDGQAHVVVGQVR